MIILDLPYPIFAKHGQSNTELQALKNYILKTEAQMSALKSHVKCDFTSNETETMSLNLWETINSQQEGANKNVELLQQKISYLQ